MAFDLEGLNIDDIKNGYTYDPATKQYRCLHCSATYTTGEVYQIEDRFYEAFRAVVLHLAQEHGSRFEYLVNSDSKYNTFTEKQKELLQLIEIGLTDQKIAAKLGISASTVRHQKFNFREKAKQAKLYLATYELAMERLPIDKDSMVPIHDGAKMVDDRYFTTTEESDKVIATVFESLSPLKLKVFSAKEKKKIITLRKIMEQFEKGKTYPEKEVNRILKDIYEDYPTLRRYLIEYGFMERSRDCENYWVK